MALYARADGDAPADRTVVWINGCHDEVEARLPAERRGCRWFVEVDSSGGAAQLRSDNSVMLSSRSVVLVSEESG
jgi:hypothetical protein